MSPPSEQNSLEDHVKKDLLKNAMKRNWEPVINKYREDRRVHTAQITRSVDTALHMAISDEREDVVEELVRIIVIAETPDALKTKDEHGNTPLHLAAYVGNATMCRCIAEIDPTLMGIRNNNSDTPLLLAVVHGRKDAFLCMDSLCEDDGKRHEYCWKGTDDESILHSAISRDHFDLAFEIMNRASYKDLMHLGNKYGMTPMHVLACKPDAFRSGSSMGFVRTLIYHCLPVRKLKPGKTPNFKKLKPSESPTQDNAESSQTSLRLGFIRSLCNILRAPMSHKKTDAEDPSGKQDKGVSFPTKEGITEMVQKIFETLGVATDNVEEEKSKALMQNEKEETPLLLSARHGIKEMVKGILEASPAAIQDTNIDEKNIVLLAVENRQIDIYVFLLQRKILKETIFYKTDKDGNSALHLAAMLDKKRNWLVTGPAFRMQWEIKWYHFVESSMPPNFFAHYNKKYQTPWEVFRKEHQKLVGEASDWLNKTSDSCSVVATLIATVAFTASVTIPGGINSDTGTPVLQKELAFSIFALSTLVALCFSISAVVMFLVFFTSRYREQDFSMNLPMKFLAELTSLIIAIAAVLISFCAGHYFVIKDSFKYTALCLYVAILFPVGLYAFWQIPVFIQLLVATLKKKPEKLPLYFN